MFESGVEISGELKHPDGVQVGSLTIELTDPIRHMLPLRSTVTGGGNFQFINVPPGTYLFRVLSLSGVPIMEKLVDIGEGYNEVTLELQTEGRAKPGTGTVPVAQLMHRVPSSAMKSYKSAQKALQKSNTDGAIEFLEEAVAGDPEFIEAQTNLGRLYVQKHQAEKALSTFGQVLKIDPHSEVAYSGSSVAEIWLQRYADAERYARRALEIDPSSAVSHYFLGISLAAQNKNASEAVQHLNESRKQFPVARITAAQVLARQNNISAATEELQGYLQSGTALHRDEVTSWLKQLKAQ